MRNENRKRCVASVMASSILGAAPVMPDAYLARTRYVRVCRYGFE